MKSHKISILIVVFVTMACNFRHAVTMPTPTAMPTVPMTVFIETATPKASPEPTSPALIGPEPSYRVAAFYYPWYRTPGVDGHWDHWGEGQFRPPLDIASDYYPALGAYSIADPAVLAQHFAWLHQAGVGVIISSWWGQGSSEDQAVALMLDIAERYGIKVAFHIEPYSGRTADRLVSDIQYLYSHYGSHPAFYRSNASSRWSQDARSKGLFFVWAIRTPDTNSAEVPATYWQTALDTIHNQPDGGLVIANTTEGDWVDGGHFDGLYNYATLHLDEGNDFSWATNLPPEAWYVPSVIPGFSARRIRYPAEDFTPRENGATYTRQWEAALGTGVEPALVTITSFNEWHEGTQIEPAAEGVSNGLGYTYEDYGSLPTEGYLTLTGQWAERFLTTTWPKTMSMRLRLSTTSDWTDFYLVSGASWLRPDLVSISEEATDSGMFENHFALSQPLTRAEGKGKVEIITDILFTGWESGGKVVFRIERGHLGATQVELSKIVDGKPVVVKTFAWSGINNDEQNSFNLEMPSEELFGTPP
jgi:glycoprotein endo-alpha-1,2-mannosidase